jgi:hypothetical protein
MLVLKFLFCFVKALSYDGAAFIGRGVMWPGLLPPVIILPLGMKLQYIYDLMRSFMLQFKDMDITKCVDHQNIYGRALTQIFISLTVDIDWQ